MIQIIAQVLTTFLAFAIFFWAAKKLFWGPLQQTIDERQARIRGEFDRIDGLQRDVAALQADYTRRIAEIEAEARQKMNDAIAQGRKIADEVAETSRRDAEAAQEHSRQVMTLEIDKARADLKQDVVRMTIAATEKVLRQQLDQQKQRELVSGFVEELAKR